MQHHARYTTDLAMWQEELAALQIGLHGGTTLLEDALYDTFAKFAKPVAPPGAPDVEHPRENFEGQSGRRSLS